MTDNAYALSANAASKRLADLVRNRTVKDRTGTIPPLPLFQNSLVNLLNIEGNIEQDDGPTKIIEVQPDFRNIVLTLNYHIVKEYSSFDQRINPLLTPAAMMAYCLGLIYSYALLCDDENVRNEQSFYAFEYNSDSRRIQLRELLATCYVPSFVKPILEGLYTATSATRKKITYIYSFAAFNLDHDYGRSFPISIYLAAHNISASTATNRDPLEIQNVWMQTIITTGSTPLQVGNYFGVNDSDHSYQNWFSIMNLALFNPVTARSLTMRPTFRAIPFDAYPVPKLANELNPYIYLLAASKHSILHTLNFFREMSKEMQSHYPGLQQLGLYTRDQNGSQIMSHYYISPHLPTFHNVKCVPQVGYGDDENYKINIGFMTPLPTEYPATNPYNDGTDNTICPALNMVNNIEAHQVANDPDQPIEYDSDFHITPDVRHLCPYETTTEHIFLNLITGKSIETGEIAGFSVPIPDSHNPLYIENGYFLESGVPLDRVFKVTNFKGQQTGRYIIRRAQYREENPIMHLDLYDRSITRLNYFAHHVHSSIQSTCVTGYVPVPHIGEIRRASNVISYKTKGQTEESTINTDDRTFYAWSSYRHIVNFETSTRPTSQTTYFLLNFRTLYGNNVPLAETPHPAVIIPAA